MNPSVSIIMSYRDKPLHLANALKSWSGIQYDNYEWVFVDDGSDKTRSKCDEIVHEFSHVVPSVTKFRYDQNVNVNIAWNKGYELSKNEFVIYAMQDIIISDKYILQKFFESYEENHRVSLKTYHLNEYQFMEMQAMNWAEDPHIIETTREFWASPQAGFEANKDLHGAELVCYVTGQFRKDWEWIGLFRNDTEGHQVLDRDLNLREKCVGRIATTAKDVCGYHQWHPIYAPKGIPGYFYENEAQARLLEPAGRDAV